MAVSPMLQRILSVPETLIYRRVDRRGARMESILVLFLGLLGSIGLAYFSFELYGALEQPIANLEYNLIGETIRPVAFLLAIWIVYTVASHILAGIYGGRGPVIRILRVSAWSLIPLGIWYIIRSLVMIYLFLSVEFPEEPEGFEAATHIEYTLELGLEDPLYVMVLLLGLPFVVWSWHLLAIGVAEVKDISVENSRKVAAVPAGIVAVYIVWITLQWQMIT